MTISGKSFRPNAAVIITDGNGRVLLCERSHPAGAIQTVQGGIDAGEQPEDAARREVQEELGITRDQFEITEALLKSYQYVWDERILKEFEPTPYVGQQQYFFLAKVQPDIEFSLEEGGEFNRVWWGAPEELVEKSWEVKRPGLRAAIAAFKRKV